MSKIRRAMTRKLFGIPAFVVLFIGLFVGGAGAGTAYAVNISQVTANDQITVARAWQAFERNQPVPTAQWSQYRQTLIDTEQAQIHGVVTTSFGFNLGVPNPIWTCPSLGFPVASTSQLTNPQQIISAGQGGGSSQFDHPTIDQPEPNGTFTGPSSGTYVACIAPDGTKYVQYWEGDVHTVGGPAHWDGHQIVLDGAPTVVTQSQQGTAQGR